MAGQPLPTGTLSIVGTHTYKHITLYIVVLVNWICCCGLITNIILTFSFVFTIM